MLAEIIWNQQSLAVVMVFAIPIVGILAIAWVVVERTRSNNDLKRSMIERGMSVDEMERVLHMSRRDAKEHV
jgi:hypothetical protein